MTATFAGDARHLERRLHLPRVVWFEEVGSTLDVAHDLAEEGAPAGTLVLADAQTAGRGRFGKSWRSEGGAGIWLTIVERPTDGAALDVLPLRIGLDLAAALDPFTDAPVSIKWPNDLYVGPGKVAGILVEARWRDGRPAWVAIGVGINLRVPPGESRAAARRSGSGRDIVLERAVPAIRAAAVRTGMLDPGEVDALAARDLAIGRTCTQPVTGRVRGIDSTGALLVDADGSTVAVRTGSLLFQEDT